TGSVPVVGVGREESDVAVGLAGRGGAAVDRLHATMSATRSATTTSAAQLKGRPFLLRGGIARNGIARLPTILPSCFSHSITSAQSGKFPTRHVPQSETPSRSARGGGRRSRSRLRSCRGSGRRTPARR